MTATDERSTVVEIGFFFGCGGDLVIRERLVLFLFAKQPRASGSSGENSCQPHLVQISGKKRSDNEGPLILARGERVDG